MGKCNLHLTWQPGRFGPDWPAVAVVRPARDGRPHAEILYKPLPALRKALEGMTPDRLESLSRELAHRRIEDLFAIEPVSDAEPTTKEGH